MKLPSIKTIKKIRKFIPNHKHRSVTAIILAAGKSERMQDAPLPKQLTLLDGIPVVVRSLLAFEKSKKVNEIIVVGAENELPLYKTFKKEYGITKLKTAVGGGASRAESASHGFQMISASCDFVAIHDAARCLITTEDIDRVIEEAFRTGAAIAAKKATDTIKRADAHGFITETVDRSSLWLAQTPQVFGKRVYQVALAHAEMKDATITDDAMLAEMAGFHVKLVACESENLKITVPQDLAVAAQIIRSRQEENKP